MLAITSFTKEARFCDLISAVQYCTLCQRLCKRTKVLSSNNGSIDSKVLFIAEAPGRLGADRTGIPLYGDKTGDNFESLISNIGWKRKDIFITNAILCNPRNEQGNNCTPTQKELKNCAHYLEMTINLVNPEVIVTLGAKALESLSLITQHHLKLSEAVGEQSLWNGRILFPLYHPGPRALIHRSLSKQRSDYIKLAKVVDPIKGLRIQQTRQATFTFDNISKTFNQAILAILHQAKELSYFKLTKLLYLIDYHAIERLGTAITGELYLRQQEGPWPPELAKSINALSGYEIFQSYKKNEQCIQVGPSPRFHVDLPEEQIELISEIVQKYVSYPNPRLKTVVYTTKPMKYLLRREKAGGKISDLPVIYKNKTAIELDSGS